MKIDTHRDGPLEKVRVFSFGEDSTVTIISTVDEAFGESDEFLAFSMNYTITYSSNLFPGLRFSHSGEDARETIKNLKLKVIEYKVGAVIDALDGKKNNSRNNYRKY